MKRSALNCVFFSLLFVAAPLQILFLVLEQWSVWFFILIPVFFVASMSQDYLYEKDGELFLRRVPFFPGIAVSTLNSISQLHVLDSAAQVTSLWEKIERQKVNNKRA